MIEKSTNERILGIFFDNPSKEFHLRELSRLSKLSLPTVISATETLSREKLVIKTKGKVLTKIVGNRENIAFVRYKRVYNLERLYTSGIVDYLSSAYNNPRLIIMFGSYSRGEDIEGSDIDIAIITNKKLNIDFSEYEKILKRGVSIHEIALEKISNEFRSNLANGIVMEGSW